jgi:hypothetical protein
MRNSKYIQSMIFLFNIFHIHDPFSSVFTQPTCFSFIQPTFFAFHLSLTRLANKPLNLQIHPRKWTYGIDFSNWWSLYPDSTHLSCKLELRWIPQTKLMNLLNCTTYPSGLASLLNKKSLSQPYPRNPREATLKSIKADAEYPPQNCMKFRAKRSQPEPYQNSAATKESKIKAIQHFLSFPL